MQNRDDVDGSQRPQTADAPDLKTPATDQDLGGHMGAGGDPAEGGEAAAANRGGGDSDKDDTGAPRGPSNTPAKE